jgi:hypothetical protein
MTFEPGSKLLITIDPTSIKDAAGAVIPGGFKTPPAGWVSSDPTILPLTVAADGMSASGVSLKAGTVAVSVIGDGVTESVSITLGVGVVATFSLLVSVVAPPPPPPPPPPVG